MDLLNRYIENEGEVSEKQQYSLILTLHQTHQATEVLSSMVEAGITNASIMDVSSMARKLAYEIPIFAGLSYLAQGKSKASQLYFSNISGKKTAEHLVAILKDNGIDLKQERRWFSPIDSGCGSLWKY